MKTFLIRYYDIGWNIHSAQVKAETIEAAIQELIQSGKCVHSDVITYFDLGDSLHGVFL